MYLTWTVELVLIRIFLKYDKDLANSMSSSDKQQNNELKRK